MEQPPDFQSAFQAFEKRVIDQQQANHIENTKKIDDLAKTLDPIARVYTQVSGFGDVVMWLFKYVIIPLSILLGVILNWKNITK